MHVHNERDFPQAKLDMEINFLFLLNERGDLYFLLLNNSEHIIFFNLKSLKNLSEGKKIQLKCGKKKYCGMQIMIAKTMTIQTFYVHVV